MKTITVLKDEVSLLKADKSAVLTELQKAVTELNNTNEEIVLASAKLAEVRETIKEETARLDNLRGRAFSVGDELFQNTEKLRNGINSYESIRVKNSHEEKRHLGRIKELNTKREELEETIENLKKLFDKNSLIFNDKISRLKKEVRTLSDEKEVEEKLLKKIKEAVEKSLEEDKKLTKDRLKREDKIRQREKLLEFKEISLEKKEEDITNMARDMIIIYERLKTEYAKIYPDVDLDKLITVA